MAVPGITRSHFRLPAILLPFLLAIWPGASARAGDFGGLTAACKARRCSVESAVLSNCPCTSSGGNGVFQSCANKQDKSISKRCQNELNSCFAATACGTSGVTCQIPPNQCKAVSNESACTAMGGTVATPGSACCFQDTCCSALPSLFSFTTASSGCGTNPPGEVTPPRCVQGSNNGTSCRRCSCAVASDCGTGGVCTAGRCSAGDATHTGCVTNANCSVGQTCTDSDADCTGGGVCRGHLDCTALYFGAGQPGGVRLPGTVPDYGLTYSKVASCTAGNPNLTPTLDTDVPGPGCPTPAGTPTYGQRHCTSPGCVYGAPLAIPNPASPAIGTCVVNKIADRPGVGTGSAVCSTGAVDSLLLPLDSQVYLTGSSEPVRVCSTCVGGTLGVCGSGTCGGGPRDGLPCTPETSALNASYPTSHDCPPPNAPGDQIVSDCPEASGSFIGCLPVDFNLSSGTQTLTSFATAAQARVFCGFCFDAISGGYESPPHRCTADTDCTNGNFTSCRQHSNGAFRNPFATSISETGTPPNVCIDDGASHPETLVSAFCIPPSYDPIIDPSGELPGPGAVALPGTAKFIP